MGKILLYTGKICLRSIIFRPTVIYFWKADEEDESVENRIYNNGFKSSLISGYEVIQSLNLLYNFFYTLKVATDFQTTVACSKLFFSPTA